MKEITAGQLIYGNVEKEHSPKRIAGFQTIFYSFSFLSEEEVEEIEKRLVYFPSEKEYVKKVFFLTSTHKYILAQILPLPEPDLLGRKGRYLAHALIFKEEDFINYKINPWAVFQNFPFVKTLEEALKLGNFETGEIPEVKINLSNLLKEVEVDFSLFKGENLKKLALLAFRGKELMSQRKTVVFLGEPHEVEQTIRLAIFAVPTSLLKYCTFDTYFYRCNLVSTYYWGVGLFDSPINPNLIIVKINSGEVLSEINQKIENSYERWVVRELEKADFFHLNFYKDSAFILAEWLDGRVSSFLLTHIPPEVVNSVFEANLEKVFSRILAKISEKIPPLLANKVVNSVLHNYSFLKLFKKLQEDFSVYELLDILLQVYSAQNYATPPPLELKALEEVLHTVEYHMLKLFYLCWKKEYKELRRYLEKIEIEEYLKFVEKVLKYELVTPSYLVVSNKSKPFLELYLSEEFPQKRDWFSLVKALLEVEEVESLVLLIPYVSQWSPQVIKKVLDLIEGKSEVPQSFREAVTKVVSNMNYFKEKKTLKSWLRSIFEKVKKI